MGGALVRLGDLRFLVAGWWKFRFLQFGGFALVVFLCLDARFGGFDVIAAPLWFLIAVFGVSC